MIPRNVTLQFPGLVIIIIIDSKANVLGLRRNFSFLILYTFGRALLMEDEPFARP
jgi:hypothetical protein